MPFFHYISVAILAALIATQYFFRPFLARHGKRIYQGVLLLAAGVTFYETHASFIAIITAAPPTRYYGPPYISIAFFLISAWSRIIAPYALSAAISLLALWGMTTPSRYQDRFEAGEPYLIAIALLVLRHPFWLIFAIVAIICYLIASLYFTKRRGGNTRISFYYLWLPLAAVILLIAPFVSNVLFLQLMSFPNLH